MIGSKTLWDRKKRMLANRKNTLGGAFLPSYFGISKAWQLNDICRGLEQTTIFTQRLADVGIDLIDVSSGGNDTRQKIKVGPSYRLSPP